MNSSAGRKECASKSCCSIQHVQQNEEMFFESSLVAVHDGGLCVGVVSLLEDGPEGEGDKDVAVAVIKF